MRAKKLLQSKNMFIKPDFYVYKMNYGYFIFFSDHYLDSQPYASLCYQKANIRSLSSVPWTRLHSNIPGTLKKKRTLNMILINQILINPISFIL